MMGLPMMGWRRSFRVVGSRPFSSYRRSVQSVRIGTEEQVDAFRKSALETILNNLRELVALVEGRLPEAVEGIGNGRNPPPKIEFRSYCKGLYTNFMHPLVKKKIL